MRDKAFPTVSWLYANLKAKFYLSADFGMLRLACHVSILNAKGLIMSVAVGLPAPDFTLATDAGSISLAQLQGKNVVLYFYPKDDTSGCTSEAKAFKEDLDAYSKLNAVIIGVSKDSVASHIKFKTKYDLPFALGADEDGTVVEAYGVWKQKSMYGRTYMGIERTTVLIDGQGIVRTIWNKVKVTGHSAAVLAALAAL